MNPAHFEALSATTSLLYQKSLGLFWLMLPVALLLSLLTIYVSGEMTGGKLTDVFRRLLIAIALVVAFPQISNALRGIEVSLIEAFGGDQALLDIFSKLGERAGEIKQEGTLSWLKFGQIGLSIITTLSFLILALVRHFLDVLHLCLWNLLQILAPLALLGCLFQSWVQVPKGIFIGLFEIALWKPLWVILARLLIAAGFGSTPKDVSGWFDTAILNFAVAGLMASTPILVHSFLGGSIASMGGSVIQTMASGAGAMLAAQPMRFVQGGAQWATNTISSGAKNVMARTSSRLRPTRSTHNNFKKK